MNAVNQKGGEPDDCDPGKNGHKQQVTEKNTGNQALRQNLAGFFIGQADMVNETRRNDRGRD